MGMYSSPSTYHPVRKNRASSDGEHPEWPPAEQLFVHKIHAPALVRALRHRNDAPVQTHVLAPPHTHAQLQAIQVIPAMNPHLVHRPSFAPEQHVNAQIPKPRTSVCDLPYPLSQRRLVARLALGVPRAD